MSSHSETVPLPGGHSLIYFRSGTRGGIPIVLLHGLSQQSDFWNPTLKAMVTTTKDVFDVITVDLRGHGASQSFTADHDLSIEALATDVKAVMEHANIRRALIVGHSMGAMVAVQSAVLFPERVSGLLLIDGGIRTPADNFPGSEPTREELIEALTPPSGPFSESTLRQYYGQLDPSNIEQIMEAVQRTYTPVANSEFISTLGIARHMQFIRSILEYESSQSLESLSVPAWAVLCQDIEGKAIDNSRPWDYLANWPHIHIQHWYGYVHDVPLQRPAMISSLINFVARVCID